METAGKLVDEEELREAMKDSGIGTPATRAAIIERLLQVGYIERDARALVVTEKGLNVIRLLGEHALTSPGLTGDWEHRLAKIETGEDSREAFMGDIVKFTEATVGELDAKLKDVRIPRANLGPCPVCGHDIVENRKGYSCWSREDPGCGFVIWKSKAGKQLPIAVARELIKTGRTEKPVTGFKGRSGKSFRARLALQQSEEGKWRVEFDEPWAGRAPSRRRPRPTPPRRRQTAQPRPRAPPPLAADARRACLTTCRRRTARHHRRDAADARPRSRQLRQGRRGAGRLRGAAARRGALLVVPTALDAGHYARELAAERRRARLGAHVLRAGRARSPRAPATRAAGSPRSSASGCCARVAGRARCDSLGRLGGRPGSPAAGELIAELQRSLVDPAAVRSRRCAPGRPATRAGGDYAQEVAALYRRLRRASSSALGRVDARAVRLAGARRAAGRAGALGGDAGVLLRLRRSAPRSSATRSRRCRGSRVRR